MKEQNKWESLFEDFLDDTDFKLIKHTDGWGLYDRQCGNLGDIEGDRFESASDIIDRMDAYIVDYFYHDLEDELWAYNVNMDGREIPEGAQDWIDLRKDEEFCNKNQEYIENHAFEFNVLDMIANHINEINLENVEYEIEEE